MGGTVIPHPRGGQVWLHGTDTSGNPVKLLATDAGLLSVEFSGQSPFTIDIPDADSGHVWIYGEDSGNDPVKIQATDAGILYVTFDGKLDAGEKMYGYKDIVFESASNTSIPSTSYNLVGAVVPSGELWHITQVCVRYVGTPPTSLQTLAQFTVGGVRVAERRTITSGREYPDMCNLYLNVGAQMICRVTGGTIGDNIYLIYCGTKQAV